MGSLASQTLLTGELPVAYVVTTGGVSAAEIATWIAPRVAPYKRPATCNTVDHALRTSSGKMLRRQFAQPAAAAIEFGQGRRY